MKTVLSTNLIAAAVIGGAFATGFVAGPAFAEEQQRATIPFDFDFAFNPEELTSVDKAERLVSRLERRVKTHCGANMRMTLADRALAQTCVDETMKLSIGKFGSEAVAQAYRSRATG